MKQLILFCLLFTFLSSWAQTNNQKKWTISIDSIFDKYKNKSLPGSAVAVIKEGKLIFKKTYGLANLEHQIAINSSTLFPIASVSKQFTGLAISMLIEQNKIELNQDIRIYLPELPEYGKKITIAHLLHHTSGIIDCYEMLTMAGWRWEESFSYDDILKVAFRVKQLNFDPGTQYSYSNTEYVLLQEIVQRVSNKPFALWTSENIFKPLGMNSSFFLADYMQVIKNKADHYALIDHSYKKDKQQLSSLPMFSTLDDMIKWTTHFNKRLKLKDPIFLRMVQDDILSNGKKVHYGFGLILGNDYGVETIMHTGAWGGYRAVIRNYPTENISVIILNNAGDNDINYVSSFKIADVFLHSKFKMEPKASVGNTNAVKAEPNEKIIISSPTKQQLSTYVGSYFSESLNTFYKVDLRNDILMLNHLRRGEFILQPHPTEPDVFLSDVGKLKFIRKNNTIDSLLIGKFGFVSKH